MADHREPEGDNPALPEQEHLEQLTRLQREHGRDQARDSQVASRLGDAPEPLEHIVLEIPGFHEGARDHPAHQRRGKAQQVSAGVPGYAQLPLDARANAVKVA